VGVGCIEADQRDDDPECGRVDASIDEDSCGTVVSASATGDARGEGCHGQRTCVTASGTGNASNDASGEIACGAGGPGCIAVSGTGEASNEANDTSCGIVGAGCVAVSGTGNASNEAGDGSCGASYGTGCIAVSGTGNASNDHGKDSCRGSGPLGQGTVSNGAGCIAIEGSDGNVDPQEDAESQAPTCPSEAGGCGDVSIADLLSASLSPDGRS
jgi:hypothetical protein